MRFRMLTLRRIVGAVGGSRIVVALGFYGRQPSRTFSEKRPYLFVDFAFFAVESTATEKIRSIGEISAKSSSHQPRFIVPALETAHCRCNIHRARLSNCSNHLGRKSL